MKDGQIYKEIILFAEPEEACFRIFIFLIEYVVRVSRAAQIGPGLGMMLVNRAAAFSERLSRIGGGVVQNVGSPNAHLSPALHQVAVCNQSVGLFQILALHLVVSVSYDTCADTDQRIGLSTGGCQITTSTLCNRASAVHIPGNHIREGIQAVLEVSGHVIPAVYAVLKASLSRPVKTIDEAMVGPLLVVVFGDQIDVSIRVAAHIPVAELVYLLPGSGSVGLEHLIRNLHECASVYVLPGIQPVVSRYDQVYGTVHSSQGQVVVCKIVRPADVVQFQGGVHLLLKDLVQLNHHLIRIRIGGLVADAQVVDHYRLRRIDIGPSCPGIVRVDLRSRFLGGRFIRVSCRSIVRSRFFGAGRSVVSRSAGCGIAASAARCQTQGHGCSQQDCY